MPPDDHPPMACLFVGGGPSSLLAALEVVERLPAATVTLVDDHPPASDHRTFALWSNGPTRFDAVVRRTWSQLQLFGADEQLVVPLGSWTYRSFDMGAWRTWAREQLLATGRVTWREGHVSELVHHEEQVGALLSDGSLIRGTWAFDARFDPRAVHSTLQQSFHGWQLACPQPVFDPSVATLMDFRAPVEEGVRFWYVLPHSPHRALAMAVTIAPEAVPARRADLHRLWPETTGARVLWQERGCLPLSTGPWPRRAGPRAVRIGIPGGRLKPSTGYGLTRMAADARALANSLATHGHPFALPEDPWQAARMDALFLRALAEHPDEAPSWFLALFREVPVDRLLRFLDGRGRPADLVAVMSAMPLRRFLGLLRR